MGSIGRFISARRGNVTLISALALPAMVGLSGLVLETGYWYFLQSEAQAAADVSAFAGAIGLRDGGDADDATDAALTEAVELGYSVSEVQVNTPPTSGTFQNGRSVEVEITYDVERFVSGIFNSNPITHSTRAIATFEEQEAACILALDTEASGALAFSGSADVTLSNCDIMSNSIARDSVEVDGSAQIETGCLNTVGAVDIGGGGSGLNLTDCNAPREELSRAQDPYAGTPIPDTSVPCSNSSGPSFSPGPGGVRRFCGGLSINGDTNFAPGVYIIDGGDFRLNSNAEVTGSGVTFFLTGEAELRFNGNADINISAPTSGPYAGLAFFGDPNDTDADHLFNGSASSSITGAIYTPASDLEFRGNFSSGSGCLQLVSARVDFRGSANLQSDCSAQGLQPALVPSRVLLVE